MITYEDFKKLEIRIGKIKSAEKAEGTDKLLKLIFDFGDQELQVMSAIAEYYPDPAVLVGREIPVLTNLEPRTFRGYLSQGMIMAADVDGYPVLLQPEKEVPPGSRII
ncbi:MAG: methionine--tRNA ligase [Patescibacteria group bacterium]|nr:methionine--tRNA ligase [Patescibacteria group bacterium]